MRLTLSKITASLKDAERSLPKAFTAVRDWGRRVSLAHTTLGAVDVDVAKASDRMRTLASDLPALAKANSELTVLLQKRAALAAQIEELLDGPTAEFATIADATNAAVALSDVVAVLKDSWFELAEGTQRRLANLAHIEWGPASD